MSPRIAAHAASFIGSGIGKSGKPWARLIAPYWFATRVISRMTDSVNVEARCAVVIIVCPLAIAKFSLPRSWGKSAIPAHHAVFPENRDDLVDWDTLDRSSVATHCARAEKGVVNRLFRCLSDALE